MTRKTLSALALTLALALASAPAALADSHEGETFDPANVPEMNQDEALILYLQWRENMLAAGVAAEDLGGAAAYFEEAAGNLSEADVDELLAGRMLSDSDAETGDDEFGKAEEDEPEMGDDEEEEDE
jgi:hypothetical protein